jgi:hypothetical protein
MKKVIIAIPTEKVYRKIKRIQKATSGQGTDKKHPQ